ncbi:MAG: TolC family protein [Myxococcota bacterium]|nr:TolC family protein [Myxococcota bacterium]
MRTEAHGTLGVASLVFALGCASHSSREDVSAIRAVLATRSELELVDRDPQSWDRTPEDVESILAEPLDVDAAVRIALLGNRSLRESLAELGVARGDLVQAGLLPNPVIDGEIRFPEDQAEPPQYDVGIEIDLTALVLAPIRRDLASARMEVARLRVAGAMLDLAYRVRIAFFRYQASAQQLELVRTAMDAFAASVAAAEALRDAGNYRDLDVAIEEAAYEEARMDVARAELEALDARERLNVLLGLYGTDVTWEASARLDDPGDVPLELDDLERRAIEASLELAEARAELDAVGRSVGLARAEGLVPDITVGFHAELDGDRWEYGPEMSIALPVLSQGQGRVLARESELEGMRERYVGTAIAVRASVRAARNRAVTTELLARRYRDVLIPARARVFEQTLRQYNAMQVDVFRLLQTRRDQIAAAIDYVDMLRQHWEARATLDQLLAGRLAGTIGRDDMELGRVGPSRAPGTLRRAEETH